MLWMVNGANYKLEKELNEICMSNVRNTKRKLYARATGEGRNEEVIGLTDGGETIERGRREGAQ